MERKSRLEWTTTSPKNPLKEVLEELSWAWDSEDRDSVRVIIVHRGYPGDTRSIPFGRIKRHDGSYIYVESQGDKGFEYAEEVPIPFHRIIQIVDSRSGRVLYSRE